MRCSKPRVLRRAAERVRLSAPSRPAPADPAAIRWAGTKALIGVAVVAVAVLVALRRGDGPGRTTSRTATTTTSATSTTTHRPRRSTGTPGGRRRRRPVLPGPRATAATTSTHYTLDLTWRADEGALDGVTTIDGHRDAGPQPLRPRPVRPRGAIGDRRRRDGRRVDHDGPRARDRHRPTAIAEGDDFTTVVTYSGKPAPVPRRHGHLRRRLADRRTGGLRRVGADRGVRPSSR